MKATGPARPQQALFEQSRTVLSWLHDLPTEAFERPTVLPHWSVRQLTGHLVLIHTGFLRFLDQPTKQAALPIHEFVTRYRRDVEMIMAATLEASEGLTGPEVVTRLESAIDDLAAKLDGGYQVVAGDQYATRSDHNRGFPGDSNRRVGRTYRRSQSISSGGDAGGAAAQRTRAVHAYPRGDSRRAESRPFSRGAGAAVRRRAVRNR